MFGGGKKSSVCPIGIDVGDHTVRMMQLTRDGGKLIAIAAAARELPIDIGCGSGQAYHHAVTEVVREMLAEGHFKGRRAVSCLPATSVQYKNLRLPKMPRDELASAVKWEASERMRFGGETMSLQFFDAGEVQQGHDIRQEVILMAAPESFVNEHIKSLTACDLQMSAIDAIPSALARCVSRGEPGGQDAKAQVVIDVGYAATKVLITQGQRVCFFKLIELGGKRLDEAVSTGIGVSLEQASKTRHACLESPDSAGDGDRIVQLISPVVDELSREVNLCLRYYSVTFRGRRPEEALVVGGESNSAWLWARLCEDADLRPAAQDPLSSLDLSPVLPVVGGPDKSASWTVSAGLSLRPNSPQGKSRGAA